MSINKHRTAVIASAVGLSLGGGAIASAASQTGSTTRPANPDEQALTGDTAAKVKAAALAKLPGATVLRVETDQGGVYEAHVRRSDGTEAEVHIDKDFKVTSVDTRPAGGRGGPGGHGGGHLDSAALAKALGVTEAKLQAALAKVRPAKGDRDAKRTEETAAIAKALGASAADVQAVLDANHPDHSKGTGTPDRSALAKALADKLGVTQEKAQAALDAARSDRATALADALAKELGLDAAKVKSALAQHPDRP